MKQTSARVDTFLFKIFLGALLVAALPVPASAEFAWKWQMSLRTPGTGDAMYMPSAVSFDPDAQRYYAVDAGRNRLVSFSRNGEMLRAFSAGDQLKSPFDMVRMENGTLWVVEKGRGSLTRIDLAAQEVKPFTVKDGENRIFPDRIAYSGGKLYVLDRASGRVLRLGADLKVEARYGCADCVGGISDFGIDQGVVWALETQGKKVFRFRADGGIEQTINLGDQVDFPVSLALEHSDVIYVLDRHRAGIAVYGRDGRFQYRLFDSGQGQGQLYFPSEVRFDPWGQLCVVDEGNGRVEIYSR